MEVGLQGNSEGKGLNQLARDNRAVHWCGGGDTREKLINTIH